MIALGLTGGMGMGKSTVAKMLVEHGCPHWDADAEVAKGYGWGDIDGVSLRYGNGKARLVPVVEELLPEAVVHHPEHDYLIVDRKVLRSAVERDPSLLDRLEERVGPWLISNAMGFCVAQTIIGADRAPVLFDAPLWFEPLSRKSVLGEGVIGSVVSRAMHTLRFVVGAYFNPVVTIAVSCPPEIQRQRCFARPGMTEEKFSLLVSRQLPDEERRGRADYVIDTTASLEEVRSRVETILGEIKSQGA